MICLITLEDRQLVIRGRQSDRWRPSGVFLHRGIAARQFQSQLRAGPKVVDVAGASMAHGLLPIELNRSVAESRRPDDQDHAGPQATRERVTPMTNEHTAAPPRMQPIVYIRPVAVADLPERCRNRRAGWIPLYAIGSETGEQLGAGARTASWPSWWLRQNDMRPVTVH